MNNKIIALTLLAALTACTQQPAKSTASAPAQAIASEVSAQKTASNPAATSTPATTIQAASQTAWIPPAKADTPKAQAQQLRDLMEQFADEAAQRVVEQRKKNMQPNHAESVALIRSEAAAVRQDAQRLQQLDLSDKETQNARDLLAKNMLAFADTADLQVQSAELLAQNKQAEAEAVNKKLGDLINGIQAGQQQADDAFNALLKKHKIER